jgi:hypothetical protein
VIHPAVPADVTAAERGEVAASAQAVDTKLDDVRARLHAPAEDPTKR